MMDYPVSDDLRAKLTRDGLRVARLQSGREKEVANAAYSGEEVAPRHSPTAGEGGEHQPMRISGKVPGDSLPGQFSRNVKRQSTSGEKPVGFDYVVHTNPAANRMPARKPVRDAGFLTCIDGGRQ